MYLIIYASNEGTTGFGKIGVYDGKNYTGENPYDYEYVRIHQNEEERFSQHIPRWLYGDIHEKMKKYFVEYFGEHLQLELF